VVTVVIGVVLIVMHAWMRNEGGARALPSRVANVRATFAPSGEPAAHAEACAGQVRRRAWARRPGQVFGLMGARPVVASTARRFPAGPVAGLASAIDAGRSQSPLRGSAGMASEDVHRLPF
jgi:hypothetical protein